jgi:hypothetical protein
LLRVKVKQDLFNWFGIILIMRIIEKIIRIERFWLSALVFFFFSFGLQFLYLDSFFWDDWLRGDSRESLYSAWENNGITPGRSFLEFSVLRNSAALFHLTTMACFVVSAIALRKILRSRLPLTVFQVNAITLLFLLIPTNSARVAIINFYSTFSYMLFFVAWSFLVSEKKYLSLLSGPIFWLSFGALQFMPFYVLPVLHFGYLLYRRSGGFDYRKAVALSTAAVLPVLFWIVRSQTFGANVREYYVPNRLGIIRGGLFVSVATLFLVDGIVRKKWNMSQNARALLIGWGVLSLAFGSAAYMAGGHLVDISDWLISFVPNFSDWNSRHQLLQPLGFALIAVGVLSGSSEETNKRVGLFGLSGLIVFSVLLNFTFSQEYYLDSLKQDQIVEQFSKIDALKTHSQVMISDDALRFNARGRSLRSYEWEAMLGKANPDESGYFVEPLRYVSCDGFKPTLILTVVAINGRLESLITRDLGIEIRVEEISPCN